VIPKAVPTSAERRAPTIRHNASRRSAGGPNADGCPDPRFDKDQPAWYHDECQLVRSRDRKFTAGVSTIYQVATVKGIDS